MGIILPADDFYSGSDTASGISEYAVAMAVHRGSSGKRRFDGNPEARRAYVARALSALAARPPQGLWEHQQDALRSVAHHISDFSRQSRALVTIPTAGGKTRIFQTAVGALGARGADGIRYVPNTIVLVPTRPLIRQTWIEFRARFPGLDVSSGSNTPLVDDAGKPIPMGVSSTTIMTYTAFVRAAEAERGRIRPEDVDLLVMDEAHRGLSNLRQTALQPFLDDCSVLALTATPAFDEEKNVHALLGAENEVYTIPAQELRQRGVIAPIINYVMSISLHGPRPERKSDTLLARRKALVDGVLDFVASHVDSDLGLALADKVTIFYGTDRSHAQMFADEYNRRLGRLGPAGRRMEVLTGEDPPERIRDVIAAVRRGEVSAISNAVLLGEGFDLPEIGLVINAPSASMLKILQQAGRMQRLHPDLPPFDPGQTSFVIDTYYKINGRILGRPRFVFESLGDWSIARTVDGGSREFADVDLAGLSKAAGLPEVEGGLDDWSEFEDGTYATPGPFLPTPKTSSDLAGPAVRKPRGRPTVRFEVSAEIENVVRMLRLRDDPIPEKTAADVSYKDFLTLVRTSREWSPEVGEIFDALESSWRTDGVAVWAEQRYEGGLRMSGRIPVFCIPEADAVRLAVAIGHVVGGPREINEDDLVYADVAKALNMDGYNPALERFWAELEDALAVSVDGGTIRGEIVMSRTRRAVAMNRAQIPLLAAHLGRELDLPEWSEEFVRRNDVCEAFSTSPVNPAFKAAWNALMETPDRKGLRAGRMRKRNAVTFFLHRDDIDAFDRLFAGGRLRPAPPKGPGDLAAHEMAERAGASYGKTTQTYFDGLIALAEAGKPVVVGGEVVACARRRSRQITPWCFREEDLPAFRRQLARKYPERTDDDLIYTDAAVALGCSTAGNRRLQEIWESCRPFWTRSEPAEIEGAVLSGRMVTSRSGSPSLCVARASLAELGRLAGIAPDRAVVLAPPRSKRQDLGHLRDFFAATRSGEDTCPQAVSAFAELERTWTETGAATFRGRAFAAEAEIFAGGPGWRFALLREEFPRLAAMLGQRMGGPVAKTADRLVLFELAKALHVDIKHEGLRAFWRDLEAAAAEGRPLATAAGPVEGIVVIATSRRSLSVARADIPVIAKHLGVAMHDVPNWTEGHLGKREVAAALNSSLTPRIDAAWKAMTADAEAGTLSGLRAIRMRKRNVIVYFLHRDDIDEFVRRYADRPRASAHETPRTASAAAAVRAILEIPPAPPPKKARPPKPTYPPRTEDWVTAHETRRIAGVRALPIWNDLCAMRDRGERVAVADGPIGFERRTLESGVATDCVRRADLPRLFAAAGLDVPAYRIQGRQIAQTGDDRVARVGLSRLLATDPRRDDFFALIAGLEREADAAREAEGAGIDASLTLKRGGHDIDMRMTQSGVWSGWTYRKDQAAAFLDLLGRAVDRKDDRWTSRHDLLVGRFATREHRDFLDRLDAEFMEAIARDGGTSATVIHRGHAIRMALVDSGESRRNDLVCYHAEDADTVCRLGRIPRERPLKNDGWLNRKEAEIPLGGRSSETDALFRGVEEEIWAKDRLEIEDGPVVRGGRTLDARIMRNGNTTVVCYSPADVATFVKVLDRLPRKPPTGWLGLKQCAVAAGVNPHAWRPLRTVWDAGHAAARHGDGIVRLPAGEVRFRMFQAQGGPVHCLEEAGLPTVLAEIEALTCRVDSPHWRPIGDLVVAMERAGIDRVLAEEAVEILVERHAVDGNAGEPIEGPLIVRIRSKVMVSARDFEAALAESMETASRPVPAL